MHTETMPARLGTAHRITTRAAADYFAAGRAVLVSEYGHESETTVTDWTTVHTRETIEWGQLVETVRMWRGRYPNQRFYLVTYDDPAPRCTYPPTRVPVGAVAPGDVLPLCGTVENVEHVAAGMRVTFPAGNRSRFDGVALGALTFALSDLVHVSRVVTR